MSAPRAWGLVVVVVVGSWGQPFPGHARWPWRWWGAKGVPLGPCWEHEAHPLTSGQGPTTRWRPRDLHSKQQIQGLQSISKGLSLLADAVEKEKLTACHKCRLEIS